MILATLGWSAWWFALHVHRIAPEQELSLLVPSIISTAAAVLGLAIALFALRAQRSWILFVLVPLFANTSLLLMPWMAADFFAR